MLQPIVHEKTPVVNPTLALTPAERATLRAAGVRLYTFTDGGLELERACPHCGHICVVSCDTHDELESAFPWYTAPDFACRPCRASLERAAWDRAAASPVTLLVETRHPTHPAATHAIRNTQHATRARRTPPRPRFSKRAAAIRDAWLTYDLTCAFLAAVERGEITATDHALATATAQRAAAARTLRRLGAM